MNTKRLLTIAGHLMAGRLGHNQFHFGLFNSTDFEENSRYGHIGCGTLGCAIGELPIIDPKNWHFAHNNPLLIQGSTMSSFEDAADYFEISTNDCRELFGSYDYAADWNSEPLLDSASREEVARSIFRYIVYNLAEGTQTVEIPCQLSSIHAAAIVDELTQAANFLGSGAHSRKDN